MAEPRASFRGPMRKPLLLLALLLAPTGGCGRSAAAPDPKPAPSPSPPSGPDRAVVVDEGGRELFRAEGVDGAFVLLDLERGDRVVVAPEIASKGFLPCSTFKIPNALIGLETGVVPDEHFTLPWDGEKRWIDAWNRDHDLASAMKHSVVWYFQEIARRIGDERMGRHLAAFGYGNGDRSAGIDRFWLEGPFRITPNAQVDFLRKLRARSLPVSAAHAELVERLIVLEERDGAVLRGKTGLGAQDDRAIGWLVGLVDRGGRSWAYATFVTQTSAAQGETIEAAQRRFMPMRRSLTTALLARHGAWVAP